MSHARGIAVGATEGAAVHVQATNTRNSSTYQRPRTNSEEKYVYILTLKTTDKIASKMTHLRQKWFPQARNKLPAHITIFHALPGSQYDRITHFLTTSSQRTKPFPVSTGKVLKRRNGVAINMGEGEREIKSVFAEAKAEFGEFLSEQDKGFKAHWTIQNKEEDGERVDEAYRDVVDSGEARGAAVGLVLWRYERDGTWNFDREFRFGLNSGEGESVDDGVVNG